MEDNGEEFRMSERQRVRGTAVAANFCESCGNLVAKTTTALFTKRKYKSSAFSIKQKRSFFYIIFSVLLRSPLA